MVLRKSLVQNKKGAMMDIYIWLIMIFVWAIFFGLWVYGFGEITDGFLDSDIKVGNQNVSDIANDSLGTINRLQNGAIELLGVGMIIAFALSIWISNYLVKVNPVFIVVYIFIAATGIMFSVYLSNSYETLMETQPLGDTFISFAALSFMMLNLPLITTVVSVFGMIFLFAGIIRDEGAGGSLT